MTVRVILDRFSVTEFMLYDENYLTKFNQEVRDVFGTPKAIWLKEHGIRVHESSTRKVETMETHIAIWAAMDDKLATEFYLRF